MSLVGLVHAAHLFGRKVDLILELVRETLETWNRNIISMDDSGSGNRCSRDVITPKRKQGLYAWYIYAVNNCQLGDYMLPSWRCDVTFHQLETTKTSNPVAQKNGTLCFPGTTFYKNLKNPLIMTSSGVLLIFDRRDELGSIAYHSLSVPYNSTLHPRFLFTHVSKNDGGYGGLEKGSSCKVFFGEVGYLSEISGYHVFLIYC